LNKVSFNIIRNENVNRPNVFGKKIMSLEKCLVKPKKHFKLEVAPKNEDR
jgi:hypothetical protein